jgi:energy-coupling factor transporter transmembrane protein EcfT
MRLADVDLLATSGATGLHHASPRVKVGAFALVVGAVIVANETAVVLAVAAVLVCAAVLLGLPVRKMLAAAAYPLVFAGVFAFAAAEDAEAALFIVARATTTAFAAVALTFTTPYPQIFSCLQSLLPDIVGDTLLMTYRSFFLLAEKASHLLRSVRLRSGSASRSPVRTGRVAAQALGGLVLYGFDLAERHYDVLRLRGYSGRMRVGSLEAESRVASATTLVVAVSLFVFSLGWWVW